MTEITVTDVGGESLSMLDFDGFKMSFYGQTAEHIRDVYKNLPDFKFREDDIFLTSYPKSGCTWTFEIMSMLLAGNSRGLPYEKGATMLDAKTQSDMEAMPSPRLVNGHLPLDKLPPDLLQKKIKTVYVIRNYKDITVSMYNFQRGLKHYNYDGKWEDWLQLHLDGKRSIMGGCCSGDHIAGDNIHPHITTCNTEEPQQKYCGGTNTLDEIRRLAKFLGVSLEDSILEEISINCQFDSMKKKYYKEKMDRLRFKEGTGFFRKGEAGDWKNWYTVSQNDMVNGIIRANMDNYESSIHFGAKYQL